MSSLNSPVPENEYERLVELLDYDIDYSELQEELGHLTDLAAKVAGAKTSLINLLDQNTQWSVARTGTELTQMPREESVCQHTIMGDEPLRINDLTRDERTRDKFYVGGADGFVFYFGVPLKTESGAKLGALCVLDDKSHELEEDRIDLLKLIAQQVVKRLETLRQIHKLQEGLRISYERQRKLSHDVRGPISGVIGVAQVLADMLGKEGRPEALEMLGMLKESGQSMLEMVEGILEEDTHQDPRKMFAGSTSRIDKLAEKLHALYEPQASSKRVELEIQAMDWPRQIGLTRNRLMQVGGNLITNAIKFTPAGGRVDVELKVEQGENKPVLVIQVHDTGVGMDEQKVRSILNHSAASTAGTSGEEGYGMGLQLVQRLVGEMSGMLKIESRPGEGCRVAVEIPFVA
ncbi:MAG: GAF domain-containing sensor histidine kinase [Akkermansiaceae bacterium]|nr:GAF domain-containing sensor histidine kinase [Akkermansiaceae bacterium]